MRRVLYLLAATAVAALPLADAAEAKDKGKGKGKWKRGHAEYSVKTKPGKYRGHATAPGLRSHCPPGLAKKDPPCVPPGLARSGDHARDHDHDHDHYHDDDRVLVRRTPIDIDEVYTEYELREITYVTTLDGDVIRVGDRLVRPIDRYPLLDAGLFGLPPLPDDDVYLRVADAAVRLDPDTQRVVTILNLVDLLID